jgi:hypothetical protein
MRIVLFVMFLIAGCTTKHVPPPQITYTVSGLTASNCAPSERLARQLREALKSRDEWKLYAERLEKLPAAKTPDEFNP